MRDSEPLSGMTLEVVAQLGNATKQAVSQAESPRRWLDYRLRQALLPSSMPGSRPRPYQQAALRHSVKERAINLVDELRPMLEALRPAVRTGRRGRPGKLSLAGFRRFLGNTETSFLRVFARYVTQQLNELFKLLQMLGGCVSEMADLMPILDTSWLPPTPRDGCPLISRT